MRQKKRSAIDVGKTLAQIYHLRPPFSTGPDGKPSSFRSGLIERCERLLVTPLRQFEPGDLRVMLGQQFYPETLVLLALLLLESDPLLDGDFFPGDLLCSTLAQSNEFWTAYPDLLTRIQDVLQRVSDVSVPDGAYPDDFVQTAIEEFNVRLGLPSTKRLK